MRILAVSSLALVAGVADHASASSCFFGPYTTTGPARLGCDIAYYVQGATDAPITMEARRGSDMVDVTGTVTITPTTLRSSYINYDCDGGVIMQAEYDEPYTLYRIELTGAQWGDELYLDGHLFGDVENTGACVEEPLPTPYCTGVNSGYACEPHGDPEDEKNDVAEVSGCNAAGGSAGLVLALLALARPRRRRG